MANQFSEDEILESVYSQLLNTDRGERIKEDLMYYVHRQSYTPGDATGTAFKEGERALATRIMQLCGEIK